MVLTSLSHASQNLMQVLQSDENPKDWLYPSHLVVLDDRRDVIELCERILGNYGAEVMTFNDPARAYSYLSRPSTAVDALITDVVLGRVNGLDYVRERASSGNMLPVVAMTGSIGYPWVLDIFRRGVLINGEDLPFALVIKEPQTFEGDLVLRTKYVVERKNLPFDLERLKQSLQAVRFPMQDSEYARACEEVVSRYFSLVSEALHSLRGIEEIVPKKLQGVVRDLYEAFNHDLKLGEVIADPVNTLHYIFPVLEIINSSLIKLNEANLPNEDADYEDTIADLVEKFTELGEDYADWIDKSYLIKLRDQKIDGGIQGRQVTAVNMLRMQKGLKPVDHGSPLDKYRVANRTANNQKKFSIRDLNLLVAHDSGYIYRNTFNKFSVLDVAAEFYQALNCLAATEVDCIIIHPRLPFDHTRPHQLLDSPIKGFNNSYLEKTYSYSAWPGELSPAGQAYLKEAESRLRRAKKSVPQDQLGMDQFNHGDYLAQIVRAMHKDMIIIGLSGWSQQQFLSFNQYGFEHPYDFYRQLPVTGKNAQEKIFDPILSILNKR
ncbi:MAG: response regulator [archaeon]